LNRWAVTSPLVFFGAGGAILIYLLYMMMRPRKGQRAGATERDTDL
jgi:hypothetical protein